MDEKASVVVLINEAFNRILAGLPQRLAAAGFADLRATHVLNVLRHLDCAGNRPADLARRAQISPQAMGELVGHLERAGYVRRERDPADARARLVVLDERGQAAAAVANAYFAEIEQSWRAALGARRLVDLVNALASVLQAKGEAHALP